MISQIHAALCSPDHEELKLPNISWKHQYQATWTFPILPLNEAMKASRLVFRKLESVVREKREQLLKLKCFLLHIENDHNANSRYGKTYLLPETNSH